jgi:hypothetical protein
VLRHLVERDDDVRGGAHRRLRGPAVHLLGSGVPRRDPAVPALGDDGVRGALDDGSEQRSRLLRSPSLGHVTDEAVRQDAATAIDAPHQALRRELATRLGQQVQVQRVVLSVARTAQGREQVELRLLAVLLGDEPGHGRPEHVLPLHPEQTCRRPVPVGDPAVTVEGDVDLRRRLERLPPAAVERAGPAVGTRGHVRST